MRERDHPPAFIVGRESGHEDEVEIGLRWLFETANGEGLVVAPTGSQFRHGPLAEALPRWPPVQTATTRTLSNAAWGRGPVLAVWPDLKMLEKIEDRWPSAICVVPWNFEEIDSWIQGRRAVDLTAQDAHMPEPAIRDPVVGEAMRGLTSSVNLGTGLLHPSDRAHAIETFRLLESGHHGWDPAEIERWALANTWDIEGAGQLRAVAQGVLEGRKFRVDAIYRLNRKALDHWRERAKSPDAPGAAGR